MDSWYRTGYFYKISSTLNGFGKSDNILSHNSFSVSSIEAPLEPPPSELHYNNALLSNYVSFISLVMSAFEWNPNTSEGVKRGKSFMYSI